MQLQTFRDHGPPDATHNKLHNCTLRSCLLRFLVLEAIIQYSLSGNLSNTTPHSFTTPSPKRRSSPRRCIQAPLLFYIFLISPPCSYQLCGVHSQISPDCPFTPPQNKHSVSTFKGIIIFFQPNPLPSLPFLTFSSQSPGLGYSIVK